MFVIVYWPFDMPCPENYLRLGKMFLHLQKPFHNAYPDGEYVF